MMDFKRHHHHQHHHHHPGFNFNPRLNNSGNGSHGGYHHHGGFGNHNHHHPHGPHSSRSFKPNEGHGHGMGGGGRLNLMYSFRNLLKMENDMAMERLNGFQKMSQHRDSMLSRISNIAGNYLKDDLFDHLVSEINGLFKDDKLKKADGGSAEGFENGVLPASDKEKNCIPKLVEGIKSRLRGRLREAMNCITEETRIYAMREDSFLNTVYSKERRVEKDFMEFFNEAERQILDYEKRVRNDQYGQWFNRIRNPEREIAIRDQKIMQLEDTLKMLNERSEKFMAELYQNSVDYNFENFQLYHHADVCRVNTKSMAVQLLGNICEWRRCLCGRDYEDILREFEANFSQAYNSTAQECYAIERVRYVEMPNRVEPNFGTSSSNFQTTCQSQWTPNQPTAPASTNFLPSEVATAKGSVVNDLRDRYEELQLKASNLSNCEEVKTMITKLVSHFKVGGFRICEEMRGKQFVSSLFYCDSKDILPNGSNKIFSTDYGDTPEEATSKSVQRAIDEIQRMENMKVAAKGAEMTFIRRNPMKNGKPDDEAIRMTLVRSYCNEKVDEKATDDICCSQEAYLYQNSANASDKYLADWKIHLRVEDSHENGLKEKLKRVLRTIKGSHLKNFIDHQRPQKENT